MIWILLLYLLNLLLNGRLLWLWLCLLYPIIIVETEIFLLGGGLVIVLVALIILLILFQIDPIVLVPVEVVSVVWQFVG